MTKRTGMVMAVGAAFAAALIGLAPAARADEPDPFQLLFGDSGINGFGGLEPDPGQRLGHERRQLRNGFWC